MLIRISKNLGIFLKNSHQTLLFAYLHTSNDGFGCKERRKSFIVWDGFKFLNSLSKNINIYVEMDCDFSQH